MGTPFRKDVPDLYCRYWYENGNIFPNMGTFSVSVDKADITNGCLQVQILNKTTYILKICEWLDRNEFT